MSNNRHHLFTSESVSEGHPDKLADRISDTILDRFLWGDAQARVACETFIADNLVVVAGEFRTNPPELFGTIEQEAPAIVRQVLRDTGYDGTFPGIDPETCEIIVRFNRQSENIARGVDRKDAIGAGDQGMVFGYASDETPKLMPLPIMLAHGMMLRQAGLRKNGAIPWLRPDAKCQVTVRYQEGEPVAVDTVVLSTQHNESISIGEVREVVEEEIIRPCIPEHLLMPGMRILVNQAGRFVIGGPKGDTGLTGRKIIVDTYGGACPHGGGAFSGKDPSKVDRSAAYAARHVAKNIVMARLAKRCTVQIAYAIGEVEPVSLFIDTHQTGTVPDDVIERAVRQVFDLTPAGIIKALDLCWPIYAKTAAYGHFGREDSSVFTWERGDRMADLQRAVSVRQGARHAEQEKARKSSTDAEVETVDGQTDEQATEEESLRRFMAKTTTAGPDDPIYTSGLTMVSIPRLISSHVSSPNVKRVDTPLDPSARPSDEDMAHQHRLMGVMDKLILGDTQLIIREKIIASLALKTQSTTSLKTTKRSVEIAIEQDEQTALAYIEAHS